MNWVFGAGLILLALAAAADVIGGRLMRAGPLYLLGAAGSGCLAVTGGFALAGRLVTLGIGGWLGGHLVFHYGVGMDPREEERKA